MRVSGDLEPDIQGDFIRGSDFDGGHTWTLAGNGWTIWWHSTLETFVITTAPGTGFDVTDSWWQLTPDSTIPTGIYLAQDLATGDATVESI